MSGQPVTEFGIFIPAFEGKGYLLLPWRDIRLLAQHAEASGLDSLWVVDHLLIRDFRWLNSDPSVIETAPPPGRIFGTHECWTLLTALAAVTERVRIGTLVACTGYRNAGLLAKMATTVDEISAGRLILGLGAGDLPDEFRMFGYPLDHPIGRFEEALQIIRPLLRTGRVSFEGTYMAARDVEILPRGPRPEGPPILIGALGTGPRMLRLVAQHAELWNGWVVWDDSQASVVPPMREAVDAACVRHGRDPKTLGRTLAVGVALPGGPVDDPAYVSGSPEQIAASLVEFAAEGITHVQAMLYPTTLASVSLFARAASLARASLAMPG